MAEKKDKKVRATYNLNQSTKLLIIKLAKQEDRSASNYLQVLLDKHLTEITS